MVLKLHILKLAANSVKIAFHWTHWAKTASVEKNIKN